MNREIKFRAWSGFYEDEMELVYSDKYDSLYRFFSEDQKFEDIMQYTGLKDKNGTEIYEGDILQYRHYHNLSYTEDYMTDKVMWGETGDSDDYIHSKHYEWVVGDDSLADAADGYYDGYECEVIGNIYENPELLEEQNGRF